MDTVAEFKMLTNSQTADIGRSPEPLSAP